MREKRKREYKSRAVCREFLGSVCVCLGGNGQKGLALLSAYVKGSLVPTV